MDQKKIGEFLRTLRKEKGLTQEQLAEKFGVSGRTVSRWETGSNMPDISIISEIADFYEIDVRELIDGERRSKEVPKETSVSEEETVSKIIEYADGESTNLSRKVMISSIIGLVCLIVYVFTSRYQIFGTGILGGLLETALLIFVYSSIAYSISYTSGRLEKKLSKRKGISLKTVILFGVIVIGMVLILASVASFLLVGAV